MTADICNGCCGGSLCRSDIGKHLVAQKLVEVIVGKVYGVSMSVTRPVRFLEPHVSNNLSLRGRLVEATLSWRALKDKAGLSDRLEPHSCGSERGGCRKSMYLGGK
jgi:hypothetical protein